MEIVHELTLTMTIVDHGCESGDWPYNAKSKRKLEESMRKEYGVDDLRITSLQSFENWSEQ